MRFKKTLLVLAMAGPASAVAAYPEPDSDPVDQQRAMASQLFTPTVSSHALSPQASKPITTQLSTVVVTAAAPLEPRRSEEHTSELQSRENLVCRLLL